MDALNELHTSDSSQGGNQQDTSRSTYASLDSSYPPNHSFGMSPENSVLIKEPKPVPNINSPPISEKVKLERKRQMNRVASSKCHKRKLEKIDLLENKVKALKCEIDDLTQVVNRLKEQIYHLKQQVMEHAKSGCHISVASAERLNVLYEKNWTRLVHQELRQLEVQVARAVQAGLAEQEVHWSFFGSLLYSLSVITTIGCGNLGPKTTEGKLATMVYALVGVPLMLICFSHLGSILAELIHSAYSCLCTCSTRRKPNERLELEERHSGPRSLEVVGGGCGRAVCRLTSLESVLDYTTQRAVQQDSDDEESPIRRSAVTDTPSRTPLIWRQQGSSKTEPRSSSGPLAPPVLAVALVTGYVCLGAWLWATWHRLSFLEGLYFTFSALTTIGLADSGRLPPKRQEIHLLFTCLFILAGLIVIATAFALIQEQVVSKTRQLAVSLGVVKKEELSV